MSETIYKPDNFINIIKLEENVVFFGPDTPLINPASSMVVTPNGGGEQSEESDGGSQRAPLLLRR